MIEAGWKVKLDESGESGYNDGHEIRGSAGMQRETSFEFSIRIPYGTVVDESGRYQEINMRKTKSRYGT